MLPQGTMVAGYRVDGVLGEGGMGTVYRATQLSLNRVVALKLLAAELSDDPGFRRRFQREGQLQAGIDHQHIVTIHEAGQSDEGLFLAMRLIPGPTLKELIRARQLNPRRALRILAQVAQALDSAHAAGLIHRDVKPQNILVGQGDHAYLTDFGLTKAPDDTEALTGTDQFVGTIDYAAPEQIQGQRATKASDCYSLTAVLYECLTGQVPFARPTEAAVLQGHLLEPPPSASEGRHGLPAALDDVIARGMAKDPAARPASATELVREATRAYTSQPQPSGGAADLATDHPTRLGPPNGPENRAQVTRVPNSGASAVARPTAPSPVSAAAPTRAARSETVESAGAPRATGQAPPASAAPSHIPARRNPAAVALVVVLAAAAVAAGFLVGRSGAGSSSTPTNFASAGHLQLRYASSWQLNTSGPTVPGITFTNPVKLAASRGQGALTAGEVAGAAGPSLLSASFRARLPEGLPRASSVGLGGLEAYRYSKLRLRGTTGLVTVYAVPTSAGVATIACTAPIAAQAAMATDCAQVAATLRVVGARAYPLGPSADYARRLSATLAKLRSAVATPTTRLRDAGTRSGQAEAGRRLAAAYSAAATGAAEIPGVSPRDRDANAAVASSLQQLADGYTRLAQAASAGDSGAYQQAQGELTADASSLRRATAGLSALGYNVGGSQ